MLIIHQPARLLFGAATGALFSFWMGLDVAVRILLTLMAIDIASGFAAAFMNRTLDSRVAWRGVGKKVITLGLVLAATAVDPLVDLPVTTAVAGFYCAAELTSLLENAALAGVPIPRVLREALRQWQEQPQPDP